MEYQLLHLLGNARDNRLCPKSNKFNEDLSTALFKMGTLLIQLTSHWQIARASRVAKSTTPKIINREQEKSWKGGKNYICPKLRKNVVFLEIRTCTYFVLLAYDADLLGDRIPIWKTFPWFFNSTLFRILFTISKTDVRSWIFENKQNEKSFF